MTRRSEKRGVPLGWVLASALATASTLAAAGADRLTMPNSERFSQLALPEAILDTNPSATTLHPSLRDATGRQTVLVRLTTAPVAAGGSSRGQIEAEQAAFINRAMGLAPSASVVASVQLALNAVVLEVDGSDLAALANDTMVTRVVAVGDYRLDLSETVPYIGAQTAQFAGANGHGVRVAVIDSGIDYTHRDLGGPGTQAAYEAAWAPIPTDPAANPIPTVAPGTGYLAIDDPGTTADDGLFPSAKVVGGYDFVGEEWPNNPALAPDPDPIPAPDASTFGGHGTHVADIIGGRLGVAPGVQLYALKSCSSPTSSCSGVALLQGIEFSLDPNGDGDLSDHVDIMNMSLGATYGQAFDDDLSAAVDNATQAGVLTVASAGNSADKQFITGTPGATATALSVAQTSVPSGNITLMRILSPVARDAGAVFQAWAVPLTSTIEGPVFYPATAAKRLACPNAAGASPFAPGELAGQIVLIDRGACSGSLKMAIVSDAGAALGIIGLVDGSAPFSFSYGGGVINIPAFMINLADANAIRAGGVVRFSPENVLSLAGTVVSSSSRGPTMNANLGKPEIGAPGASISASSGSFTGTSAFGGTSGAAPMVAGAAAIIRGARPNLAPLEIKQLLVNTADPNVAQPSVAGSVFPDQVAPISRIGGGEVRVDRALFSPTFVTDVTGDLGSSAAGVSSGGYIDVSLPVQAVVRTLRIKNISHYAETYRVLPNFRYQDDADTRAVSVFAIPSVVRVAPGRSATVRLLTFIDGKKLRNNLMNAGSLGNAIGPLTANEYDGYVTFQAQTHAINMPAHMLPRKAARVVALNGSAAGQKTLFNLGVGTAQLQTFSLLGLSPNAPQGGRGEQMPNPDLRAVGVNSVLDPGICGAPGSNFIWEFAFNTWERVSTPVGQFLEVDLDTNGDGVFDYIILNRDLSGLTTLSDGRQVSAVLRLSPTGAIAATSIRFFAENATNTGNTVLRACGNDLGLGLADAGTRLVTAEFYASSWYFGGDADFLGPYVITPGGEQNVTTLAADTIDFFSSTTATVQEFSPIPGTSEELGVMLITNSDFGAENRGGATQATETVLIPKSGTAIGSEFQIPGL
ncbi:MAG: S8 family serine peptidase [Proteobacteria bacterium]|nr:S8 family serine peptidase [Pseudomonadota bacterium]